MNKKGKKYFEEIVQYSFRELLEVELGDTVQFLDTYIYIEFDEPNDKFRIEYPSDDALNQMDTDDIWLYILENIIIKKYGEI